MRPPRITFIIPSYQQGKYLGDALDSIAAQNLPPDEFELLVYDAGSTDSTVDILKSHSTQPIWRSAPDRGQADAVNQGLRVAQGDIIAWLNADDYYLPGALSRVIEYFDTHPEAEILYGQAINVNAERQPLPSFECGDWDYEALLTQTYICQPAVFFRRSIYERFGGVDESLHLTLDYEYWLRIGKVLPLHYLPVPLAANRCHTETKTLCRATEGRREFLRVVHRHTGRWSPVWLDRLAYYESRDWLVRRGIYGPNYHWLAKRCLLACYRLGIAIKIDPV